MIILIWVICTLVSLDTLIGNRIFPSEVFIKTNGNGYCGVVKKYRILFLFRKLIYLIDDDGLRMLMGTFSLFEKDVAMHHGEKAIRLAKIYSNQTPKKVYLFDKIWSSKGIKAEKL